MARRPARAIWIGLICAVVISWWIVLGPRLFDPVSAPLPPGGVDRAAGRPIGGGGESEQPRVRSVAGAEAAATAVCSPRADKACSGGDVFWVDSCGRATELIEACHGRACLGISCAPPGSFENRCGSVSAYGRCEGDVARACIGGEVVSVDCAKRGQRCISGREGAECKQPGKDFCTGREPPRCEGTRLVECIDGQWQAIDCAFRKAECVVRNTVGHCVTSAGSEPPARIEICNRLDDDDDSFIDEGLVCDNVALIPLVAAGAVLTDLEERMQRDLAIVNRIYQPLVFHWERVLDAPDQLAHFPAREVLSVAGAINTEVSAQLGAGFFVPVVFVQTLDIEPPKSGISTLPNNRCGGVRVEDAPAPPHGLIVLADQRMPETLAHEIGHYLGLCHTHEQVERYAVLDGETPACELTGDGVCDTAFDPGPQSCVADATCSVSCTHGDARPAAADLMSYYLGCRQALSAEQLHEVERNLALRREWSRCLDANACACKPGAPGVCPTEMSCRPAETGSFACGLDGPGLPGAPCRDSSQCSLGGLCLKLLDSEQARGGCARACLPGATSCECVDIGLSFSVCKEDLPAQP